MLNRYFEKSMQSKPMFINSLNIHVENSICTFAAFKQEAL